MCDLAGTLTPAAQQQLHPLTRHPTMPHPFGELNARAHRNTEPQPTLLSYCGQPGDSGVAGPPTTMVQLKQIGDESRRAHTAAAGSGQITGAPCCSIASPSPNVGCSTSDATSHGPSKLVEAADLMRQAIVAQSPSPKSSARPVCKVPGQGNHPVFCPSPEAGSHRPSPSMMHSTASHDQPHPLHPACMHSSVFGSSKATPTSWHAGLDAGESWRAGQEAGSVTSSWARARATRRVQQPLSPQEHRLQELYRRDMAARQRRAERCAFAGVTPPWGSL